MLLLLQNGFNTQPPEGGWKVPMFIPSPSSRFQHTAARRRLDRHACSPPRPRLVSTHSRPKAAGRPSCIKIGVFMPFQHTAARRRLAIQTTCRQTNGVFQHTAARRRLVTGFWGKFSGEEVSTHSRPKAAGATASALSASNMVSTHSRPKAAGCAFQARHESRQFQHTAARRRLGFILVNFATIHKVSTHSRPKAAG